MAASSWRFPPAFWTANVIELCERAAYYGWFIMLAPFLTDVVGYSDIQSGYIGGLFAAFLYLLPFLSGAFADRVGYRRALLLALLLLTLGYGGIGLVPKKHWVLLSMLFIMVGGLIVSQALTLFTTPVIYLAFDRLARRFHRPAPVDAAEQASS